jgi:hypothetical protein
MYWHMGGTAMRLRRFRSFSLKGVKRADMGGFLSMMKMRSTSAALAQHSLRLFVNLRTMEGV